MMHGQRNISSATCHNVISYPTTLCCLS